MRKPYTHWVIRFCVGVSAILLFLPSAIPSRAANVDELRSQLQAKENAIAELEAEIRQYQKDIEETGKEADSFQAEVNRLTTTIKKLQADITVTRRKIEFTGILIEELDLGIQEKEEKIQKDRRLLGEFIRELNDTSSQSMVEILLANATLSDFFDSLHYVETLQNVTQQQLDELRTIKREQEEEKAEREKEKATLNSLAGELQDRTAIEKSARDDKAYLLDITRQKESEYQKLLDERLAKKEALEQEIRGIEDQIRVAIDPNSLPQSGTGVLGWPLEYVSLLSCFRGGNGSKNCITQFFGNTDFATQNPQVYNGKGHNGTDFRATTGTPLYAAESGIVRDVGDTDQQCRGVSYGKWVLIDHNNGLSTLYAHLSQISIASGQTVVRGQRIGYSGNTGYSTGPHLHFTVFATQAVQVTSLNPNDTYYYKSKICGTPLHLPISPQNGYLNPLSYL
ncbi:MAG: hypothetical protein COU47_00120 [Candidatus Niyogibacteria bacterium CG10_big_fil_rev_8_21_14_0_10_46_36]|uniref:M23ase beta-sheet core domain-containing protein n=1 Tax=Candidatus Niyogibacteria bacterium CG10_big_fil_rev_8_21_14_0_10_46_36 TaxID=1974726 RepID=A0A2H0TE59_9BACT|nr:MAG: hypothetical protein COU47_00120 [Candidatus Niyogibacteria bacterium CG10_big_fil_rev_8_21_14_0_10_46_36]